MPDLERLADRILRRHRAGALASMDRLFSQVFTPFVALAGAPGLHRLRVEPRVHVPVRNKLGTCWGCHKPSAGLQCRACFWSTKPQAKRRRLDAHRATYGPGLDYALTVLEGSVQDFAPALIDRITERELQVGPAARWSAAESVIH